MTFARIGAMRSAPLEETLAQLILPVSVIAISLSALLLFVVEPMFAKMALPALGGSPAVWSVAMVFFQTVMLLGYIYAHVLTKVLPVRIGALVHIDLLGLAFLFLPVGLRAGEASQDNPAFWLIGVFGFSVGLPFFALSAQGPLLQAWFARSDHPCAKDPYFLYAASNIGSFAALVAYPFVIEPLFGLSAQATTWTIGFVVMAGLVAAAGFTTCATPTRDDESSSTTVTAIPTPRIAPMTFLKWVGLSLVPSGLMVSVTAHISTDIAATPLLWVIPPGPLPALVRLDFPDSPSDQRQGSQSSLAGHRDHGSDDHVAQLRLVRDRHHHPSGFLFHQRPRFATLALPVAP